MTDSRNDLEKHRGLEALPSDGSLDATLAFLRDGYTFVSRRCDRLGSDAFRTRIMGRSAVCVRGPDWTQLFYGSDALTRVGAMPAPILRLLQDKGSVQQLDGAAHRHRKALFVDLLMDEARVRELAEHFRATWLRQLPGWQEQGSVCLLTGVSRILAEAACDFTGVALDRDELEQLSGSLFRMVDQAGRPRIATLGALAERRRTERRLQRIVRRARTEGIGRDTPLARIARYRDPAGELLTPQEATVELINVLRPTVAIGRYIAFAAVTLEQEPRWRASLRADPDLVEPFCEEVRRRAPFFPGTAAITTRPLTWNGLQFPKGQWLVFDLFGTLHDSRWFPRPEDFDPHRRLSWRDGDERFVPQGGGDVATSHRCPGEAMTVALMSEAVRLLCDLRYSLPEQDLTTDLTRIPAQPASGVVIEGLSVEG